MDEEKQMPESIRRLLESFKQYHTEETFMKGLHLKLEPSDVILSTPLKSGTTVTQQVHIILGCSLIYTEGSGLDLSWTALWRGYELRRDRFADSCSRHISGIITLLKVLESTSL